MEKLTVEESGTVPVKQSGFFLTKKVAILIASILAAIYVGSILATYYGKPDSCKDSDLFGKCEKLVCDNRTLYSSNLFYSHFKSN
jgi:hypothetical protein